MAGSVRRQKSTSRSREWGVVPLSSVRHLVVGSAAGLLSLALVAGASPATAAERPTAQIGASHSDQQNVESAFTQALNEAFASEAGAGLTPSDRARIRSGLLSLAKDLKESARQHSNGTTTTQWSVGLGLNIYIKNLTPTDQRFFLQAGVSVITGLLIASGVASVIAGPVAGITISAIGNYYRSRCNITLVINYNLSLRRVEYVRCW